MNAQVEHYQPESSAGQRCTQTTCPYCGTGCGVSVTTDATGKPLALSGDRAHPTNAGALCSKGSNLLETLDLDARLRQPEVDGQPCDWDHALAEAATRLKAIIAEHGPESVAIYASGQMLTEDYYVANKLMKGYLGTANIDTNSRLCMASAVAGQKRAFGADAVPASYADLDDAELWLLTGSNAAWCHPILYRRIREAKAAHPERKLVVIDPRRTASCELADLHLALKPGSDALLFNGLLVYLADRVQLDYDFIDQHTEGFGDALRAARNSAPSIERVATGCELSTDAVETFYRWFATTPKTVTAFSQGINQSSSGTDKVNAILNLHLATGRISKPGATPFSLTGQPNAMGGREVGGLANQLAAHLELDNPEHRSLVQRFWNSPHIAAKPGHKAVDLFRAIERGEIKAVWVIATNPVDSLPDADRVRAALKGCELVLLSDCMRHTDMAALAHIRFAACGWGEKDGTVTNAERRISRQRPFSKPSGESKPDWWIISQLAQRLGFGDGFNYEAPWQIFREHAALTAFENTPDQTPRLLNLTGLAALDAQRYDALQPLQWPVTAEQPEGKARLFEDGHFATANGLARLLPISPSAPQNRCDSAYPLTLNSGRVRDQWHTMTRTGLSPRLSVEHPEPLLEIHPEIAAALQLQDGQLVRARSRWGDAVVRLQITETVRPGDCFLPMHWTDQYASQGRVGALVNPVTDPISGQPESKATPVAIEPFESAWQGVLFSREGATPDCAYWIKVSDHQHQRFELAGTAQPANWQQTLCDWLEDTNGEWLSFSDPSGERQVKLLRTNGRLQAVLLLGDTFTTEETIDAETRLWIAALFQDSIQNTTLDSTTLARLLRGQAPKGGLANRQICACKGVTQAMIETAIADGCQSVAAVSTATGAGTGCGNCREQIEEIVTRLSAPKDHIAA